MSGPSHRNGRVMIVTGVFMLLGSVLYLFLAVDPFPMWLIIGGAGVMFIGAGSAIQRQDSGQTRR